MAQYSDFNLSEETLKAVERMGFTEMTEIQEKAIPVMMEGREIIAKAPTGTGKTCAFGIPIMEKIDPEKPAVQAIVLCPTRELSTQIVEELRQLAYFRPDIKVVAVYGGQPIDKQINALKRGAQIVVATPGRMLDHMHRRTDQPYAGEDRGARRGGRDARHGLLPGRAAKSSTACPRSARW